MGIVVIPAYKPDEKLPGVIRGLRDAGVTDVLVVNDGSGPDFDPVFREVESLGCTLLVHEVNRGKGAALKTAFRYLSEKNRETVICTADADGQHLPKDIAACLAEAEAHPGTLVIGGRGFTGNVPLRSRLGNAFSRHTFHLFTGAKVHDTQTGLRAFSPDLLPLVANVAGDRYEYEMQMLCDAAKAKIPVREIPIETVYLEDNASSHFNALRDAMRVYGILLKNGTGVLYQIFSFIVSSGLAWIVDALAYMLLFHLVFEGKEWVLPAATLALLIARIASSLVNFLVNRGVVFKTHGSWWAPLAYALLVVAVFFGNDALNRFFLSLAWPTFFAYVGAQLICFPVSFLVQKLVIFRKRK
ncbi:MAG: bifunctional glycosyltransferase family 2/GtrA family protein [Clostridia bacterium]|nr:bifunctional glycosyltransferase family 2/GtrA family protein [Clostridia bacterium]